MTGVSEAMIASDADSWAERNKAVALLGCHLDDPRARNRLAEMLDDENAAVIEVAADQLVAQGGPDGLARAAEAFIFSADNGGYWIADAITGLRFEGFPVDDAVNDLREASATPREREAAAELAGYLYVERRPGVGPG